MWGVFGVSCSHIQYLTGMFPLEQLVLMLDKLLGCCSRLSQIDRLRAALTPDCLFHRKCDDESRHGKTYD